MGRKKELVYGVGINDADYPVYKTSRVHGKLVVLWQCPFYLRWKDMIRRCYSEKLWIKNPTYTGCYTTPEWHSFMSFRAWMETQDWKDKHLDKDILFPGNKIYSPNTCVFVDQKVNKFFLDRSKSRGSFPVGVDFHKGSGKYRSQCNCVITDNIKYLGLFITPEEAHEAWLSFKLEQAKILAAQQTDQRVAKALIERYKNYQSF